MTLTGLDECVYTLQTYHSWGDFSNIKSVTAKGEGVIEIQIAINVTFQPTTVDDEPNPSEVRFYTDGTATMNIIYEATATSNACVNKTPVDRLLDHYLWENTMCSCSRRPINQFYQKKDLHL